MPLVLKNTKGMSSTRSMPFCVVAIRNAKYNALRGWSRKYKRKISLEYLTEEMHHPLGTNKEYVQASEPDKEYILNLCNGYFKQQPTATGLLIATGRGAGNALPVLFPPPFTRENRNGTGFFDAPLKKFYMP